LVARNRLDAVSVAGSGEDSFAAAARRSGATHGSHRTHRWRETDSNPRSRCKRDRFFSRPHVRPLRDPLPQERLTFSGSKWRQSSTDIVRIGSGIWIAEGLLTNWRSPRQTGDLRSAPSWWRSLTLPAEGGNPQVSAKVERALARLLAFGEVGIAGTGLFSSDLSRDRLSSHEDDGRWYNFGMGNCKAGPTTFWRIRRCK
jgi:hypothetical protein